MSYFLERIPSDVPALLRLLEKINQLMFVHITVENYDMGKAFEGLNEAEIQKVAYCLWQEKGCPTGQDLDTCLEAREVLRHRHAAHAANAPKPTAAPISTRTTSCCCTAQRSASGPAAAVLMS